MKKYKNNDFNEIATYLYLCINGVKETIFARGGIVSPRPKPDCNVPEMHTKFFVKAFKNKWHDSFLKLKLLVANVIQINKGKNSEKIVGVFH